MPTSNPLAAPPLVDDALLAEVVRRMLAVGSPRKIVLFGSHARGDARAGSDLDLLVVEDICEEPSHKRATAYRMALSGLHPDKDILVYTSGEIEEWAAVPQAFITTALREGRVLYEKPD